MFAENAVQHHDELAAKNVREREKLAEVQRGILLARLPPRPATRQGVEEEFRARMANASMEGAVSTVKWDKGQALKRVPSRGSLRRPASEEPADAGDERSDEEERKDRSEKMSAIFARGPTFRHKERAAVWDEAEGRPAGATSEDEGALSWIDRIPQEAVVQVASYRQRAKPGMGLTEEKLSPMAAAAKGGGGEKRGSIGSWLDDSLHSSRLSPDALVSSGKFGQDQPPGGVVTFGTVASSSALSSAGASVERGEEASGDGKGHAASAAPVDRSETPAENPPPSTTPPKSFWARLPSREGRAPAVNPTSSPARQKSLRMLPAPATLTLVDGLAPALTPEQVARQQERLRPKNLVSRGLAKLGLRW